MELSVGMYVRTEYGIDKIKDIVLNGSFYEDSGLYLEKRGKILCGKEAMKDLKASHNIIDLIEVGDYVNGYKVLNVLDFNDNTRMLSLEKIYDSNIEEADIKSIVTKEQFESMSYKVGE